MANRRMFAKSIVRSDAFLDMPISSQCLYYNLNMEADDEGFIGNPKSIIRQIGVAEDDFKLLIAKNFVIYFKESGVALIKHWRINNQIRADRFKPTTYIEEKGTIAIKKNNAYTLVLNYTNDEWQPNGNQMATIGKPSLVKSSIVKDSIGYIDGVMPVLNYEDDVTNGDDCINYFITEIGNELIRIKELYRLTDNDTKNIISGLVNTLKSLGDNQCGLLNDVSIREKNNILYAYLKAKGIVEYECNEKYITNIEGYIRAIINNHSFKEYY